jgi:hypothetical protein
MGHRSWLVRRRLELIFLASMLLLICVVAAGLALVLHN